jgi:hypothetical protein
VRPALLNNVASLEDFDEFIDVDLVAKVLVDELEHALDAASICCKVILELIEGCFNLTSLSEGNSHELPLGWLTAVQDGRGNGRRKRTRHDVKLPTNAPSCAV